MNKCPDTSKVYNGSEWGIKILKPKKLRPYNIKLLHMTVNKGLQKKKR